MEPGHPSNPKPNPKSDPKPNPKPPPTYPPSQEDLRSLKSRRESEARKRRCVSENSVLVTALRESEALEALPIYTLVRDLVDAVLWFVWRMEVTTDAKVRLASTVPPLLNQLSRSATSVSANLAEGEGRTRTTGHYRQFILIARGSFVESIDHLRSFRTLMRFDGGGSGVEGGKVEGGGTEGGGAKHGMVFGAEMAEMCDGLIVRCLDVLKTFDAFIEATLEPRRPHAAKKPKTRAQTGTTQEGTWSPPSAVEHGSREHGSREPREVCPMSRLVSLNEFLDDGPGLDDHMGLDGDVGLDDVGPTTASV